MSCHNFSLILMLKLYIFIKFLKCSYWDSLNKWVKEWGLMCEKLSSILSWGCCTVTWRLPLQIEGGQPTAWAFQKFLTLSNQMAHNATFSVHKRNKSVKDEALEAKSVSLLCCNLLKQIPEKPKNTYLRLKEVFKKNFLN